MRLLVVEDEPDLLAGLARALRKQGCAVDTATDGEEGLYKAICYNHPGGSVQVKVASEPGIAILVVRDTGSGIASKDLPRIFERFYRADKARSNATGHTGLGLAIAKTIVEAHGGTIQVASEPGRGSTFTVRLTSAQGKTG